MIDPTELELAAKTLLTPADRECIDLLDWKGPLTAGEIGLHLGVGSGAVTGLIDRREAGLWLYRERDQHDRRRGRAPVG